MIVVWQVITFSKAIVMYLYIMKIVKFGATCISDHLLQRTTFVLATFAFVYSSHPSNQPKIVSIED